MGKVMLRNQPPAFLPRNTLIIKAYILLSSLTIFSEINDTVRFNILFPVYYFFYSPSFNMILFSHCYVKIILLSIGIKSHLLNVSIVLSIYSCIHVYVYKILRTLFFSNFFSTVIEISLISGPDNMKHFR